MRELFDRDPLLNAATLHGMHLKSARLKMNDFNFEEKMRTCELPRLVASRGRRDRDWPGTDHNDLTVCTHFFWRLEILIILRRDTARSVKSRLDQKMAQSGIGDGGDGRGASGIWRSASPGDLLRSVVGAAAERASSSSVRPY